MFIFFKYCIARSRIKFVLYWNQNKPSDKTKPLDGATRKNERAVTDGLRTEEVKLRKPIVDLNCDINARPRHGLWGMAFLGVYALARARGGGGARAGLGKV